MPTIQSIQYLGDNARLVVERDDSLEILDAQSGDLVEALPYLEDAVVDLSGSMIVGINRGYLLLWDMNLRATRWKVRVNAYVLHAAFAKTRTFVSINDGHVLSVSMDGRSHELHLFEDAKATVMRFGYNPKADTVSAWCATSIAGRPYGLLVLIDQERLEPARILSRMTWQWAKPLSGGTCWVFEDGKHMAI